MNDTGSLLLSLSLLFIHLRFTSNSYIPMPPELEIRSLYPEVEALLLMHSDHQTTPTTTDDAHRSRPRIRKLPLHILAYQNISKI